jgi:hypothetical protein
VAVVAVGAGVVVDAVALAAGVEAGAMGALLHAARTDTMEAMPTRERRTIFLQG